MALFGVVPYGVSPFGGSGGPGSFTGYTEWLKRLFPDSHNVDGEVYTAILGAVGTALDSLDPFQMGLPSEFAVTTATGEALDKHGADWGVPRRAGETDNDYRIRILAMLFIYANSASVAGITAAVALFTGANPIFIDCSSDGWICSVSSCLDSAMSDLAGVFTVYIYVQNPDSVSYSHYDMQFAVRRGLPARSRAILIHNGIDTSPLAQAPDEVVEIIG